MSEEASAVQIGQRRYRVYAQKDYPLPELSLNHHSLSLLDEDDGESEEEENFNVECDRLRELPPAKAQDFSRRSDPRNDLLPSLCRDLHPDHQASHPKLLQISAVAVPVTAPPRKCRSSSKPRLNSRVFPTPRPWRSRETTTSR